MKKVKKMIMDLIAQVMEEEIAKIEASLVKFEKDREEQHEVYKTAAKHLEDTIYAAAQAVDVMKPAKREVDRVQLTPTVRRALAYAEMFAPEEQRGDMTGLLQTLLVILVHVPWLMPLKDDSALFLQKRVVKFFPEAMSLSSMMIEEAEMDHMLIAGNNHCETWPTRRRIARRRKCSGQMYLELPALADTIKTLNDDDALELFKKTLPSSFVQKQVIAD